MGLDFPKMPPIIILIVIPALENFLLQFRKTHQLSQSEPKTQITATYYLPDRSFTRRHSTTSYFGFSLSSLYSIRTVNILFHFKHFRLYKRIVVVDDDVCMHSLKVWYKKDFWRFRKCFMMFQKGASPIENPVKPKAAFLHVLVFFEAKVLIHTEEL